MKARDVTLRLAVSFCLLAAVLLVVGWQGIHHLRQINAQMQNIVAKEWGKLQLAHEALRISDQISDNAIPGRRRITLKNQRTAEIAQLMKCGNERNNFSAKVFLAQLGREIGQKFDQFVPELFRPFVRLRPSRQWLPPRLYAAL